jgi:protein subunit release factor B
LATAISCLSIEGIMTDPDDLEALERDTDMTFFVAGGPGGQHRNKVATGVRLVHRPSGTVVTATERRSQAANREVAFARMAARLQAASERQAPRIATRPRAAAVAQRRKLKQRRSEVKQARRQGHDDD